MPKFQDLTGQKFGDLTVIEYYGKDNFKHRWLCKCECKNMIDVRGNQLSSGKTKSCGCWKTRHAKHGMCGTRFYTIWENMISRCYSESYRDRHRYSDRGITVCDRWREFTSFRDDMLEEYERVVKEIPNCQLDRRNNNGNYEPDNCRFVSPQENSANRENRARRFTDEQAFNIRLLCDNGIYTIYKLSKVLEIPETTIRGVVKFKTYKGIGDYE